MQTPISNAAPLFYVNPHFKTSLLGNVSLNISSKHQVIYPTKIELNYDPPH